MIGSYRGRALFYAGLVLAAPSCSFRLTVPTNRIGGNEDIQLRNPRPHDAPGLDFSHLKDRLSQWDAMYTRNLCITETRRGQIKELASGGSSDGARTDNFYRHEDLEAFSAPWGITLRYKSTLNTYRIEAYRTNGELAGYTTGFYMGNYLHLDKLQIQRKESAYELGAPNAPAPGTRDIPWTEKSNSVFQLGAVLGCAAMRYAWDRGARRVELLAIRESGRQHTSLVRYYRIAGFRAFREVGEDLGSLRDRLLWGAEGTLMGTDIEDFMRRWTPMIRSGAYLEPAAPDEA